VSYVKVARYLRAGGYEPLLGASGEATEYNVARKGLVAMPDDPVSARFGKKEKAKRLADFAQRGRSVDEIKAEEELLKKTPKTEPIKADKAPDRNAPCPCGSGKKYKKCCGAGK
jgi:hypothetical protein